jgi:hypothetical protein
MVFWKSSLGECVTTCLNFDCNVLTRLYHFLLCSEQCPYLVVFTMRLTTRPSLVKRPRLSHASIFCPSQSAHSQSPRLRKESHPSNSLVTSSSVLTLFLFCTFVFIFPFFQFFLLLLFCLIPMGFVIVSVGLKSDQVLALNRQLINPRQPTGTPTAEQQYENLIPYNMRLPFNTLSVVSYNNSVSGENILLEFHGNIFLLKFSANGLVAGSWVEFD